MPGPPLHLIPAGANLRLHGEWNVEGERPLHGLNEQRNETINFTVRCLKE
jgi:hypothetical protein